ncbi:hypothetical protein KIH07_16765 [Hydrogenophaga taeniospiralis]|nr:hypothetical protein [Hydrogenophaga taeniospiralis]
MNLGLRPDVLVAGFAGALVAIVLLGSVPASGDTWRHLVRTTGRRLWVSLASSITAGYLTPAALVIKNLPDALLLAAAFSIGAFAQWALRVVMERYLPKPRGTPASGGPTP